jgi:hypothetical protein
MAPNVATTTTPTSHRTILPIVDILKSFCAPWCRSAGGEQYIGRDVLRYLSIRIGGGNLHATLFARSRRRIAEAGREGGSYGKLIAPRQFRHGVEWHWYEKTKATKFC